MSQNIPIAENIVPLFGGLADPSELSVRKLCDLYLESSTGAKILKPATQRLEKTRLGWWKNWNGNLEVRLLSDPKVDEFIQWRRAQGNHANGRANEPLHPATLDLHVISMGNACLWGFLNDHLKAVPFPRRGAKRGRLPTEVMKAIKLGELDQDDFGVLIETPQVERLLAAIEKPIADATHPRNWGQLARAVGIARQNLVCYHRHEDFPKPNPEGYYDVEEFKAFLARHDFQPGPYGVLRSQGQQFDLRESPESRWLAAEYLRVLAFGGGRREATRKLFKSDILLPLNHLLWRKVNQKSGHGHVPKKDFYLDINPRLKETLLRLLKFKPESRWLFPSPLDLSKPISASALQRYLDEALEATGIEDELGEAIGFHAFRHYFIAKCVANPLNDLSVIAEWVCHTTTEMIVRVYLRRLRPVVGRIMAANLKF
jgi:integrase